MERKHLFNTLAGLIVFIFLANALANKFYWYSSIWFYDILMHFLGGLWVGILVLYILKPKEVSLGVVKKVLLSVLAIGLAWEVYEFGADKVFSQNGFNVLDSTADMFFDVAGGAVAVFYYLKKLGREGR